MEDALLVTSDDKDLGVKTFFFRRSDFLLCLNVEVRKEMVPSRGFTVSSKTVDDLKNLQILGRVEFDIKN